jgi:hypothetical protein
MPKSHRNLCADNILPIRNAGSSMATSTRLALDEVSLSHENCLVTQHGEFDAVSYGRMKYGHIPPARTYGYRLADLFVSAETEVLFDPTSSIVVCGPATSHTPKPAHVIAYYFTQVANLIRVSRGLPPGQLVDIRHTEQGEPVPYASLDLDGRRSATALTRDYIDPNIIRGAHVVCIDDAVVTGTVEEKMTELLEPLGAETIRYLYAIKIAPELAANDPGLEDRINLTGRPDLDEIAAYIERNEFHLNDRVMTLLLTYPDRANLYAFLKRQCNTFLEHIVCEAMAGGLRYASRSTHLLPCLSDILTQRDHPLLETRGANENWPLSSSRDSSAAGQEKSARGDVAQENRPIWRPRGCDDRTD